MSLLERLEKERTGEAEEIKSPKNKKTNTNEKTDPFEGLKKTIQKRIVDELSTKLNNIEDNNAEENLENEIIELIEKVLIESNVFLSRNERQKITSEIVDEVIGFGPINSLIHDPAVSEIMVNGHDKVYVEQKGKLVLTDIRFRDNDHVCML